LSKESAAELEERAVAIRNLIGALALIVSLTGGATAGEMPSNFVLHPEPVSIPEVYFGDSNGVAQTLSDFRGKMVFLSLWTPSCMSCPGELLALDRLQSLLGGSLEVVAVSLDPNGCEPGRFHTRFAIKELGLDVDTSAMTVRELGVEHLPTTLLIDESGREIGRLVGPTEWDEPNIMAFLRDRIDSGPDGQAVSTSYFR
jgi:thiol-disulfide isomerase/thioredoxin